jgi:predicted nucleic acid-binding Zn ribbon protein
MILLNKTCPACGVDFKSSRKDRQTCSEKCKTKLYYTRNREAMLARAATWRAKNTDWFKNYESGNRVPRKNRSIPEEARLKSIASAIGKTYRWIYQQWKANGANIESVDAFTKWRKEFTDGTPKKLQAYWNSRKLPTKTLLANARIRRRRWYHVKKRDPAYKLRAACSSRIWYALKKGSLKKSDRTLALIGCSVAFLRQWLESQFAARMTWENHGTAWDIDHIIPVASWDLSDPKQQRLAFHYTNLRPLWKKANIRKSSKILEPQISLLLPP